MKKYGYRSVCKLCGYTYGDHQWEADQCPKIFDKKNNRVKEWYKKKHFELKTKKSK